MGSNFISDRYSIPKIKPCRGGFARYAGNHTIIYLNPPRTTITIGATGAGLSDWLVGCRDWLVNPPLRGIVLNLVVLDLITITHRAIAILYQRSNHVGAGSPETWLLIDNLPKPAPDNHHHSSNRGGFTSLAGWLPGLAGEPAPTGVARSHHINYSGLHRGGFTSLIGWLPGLVGEPAPTLPEYANWIMQLLLEDRGTEERV